MNIEKNTPAYPVRVGILQRVLAHYRRDFFALLSSRKNIELSVASGRPRIGEGIVEVAGVPPVWWHQLENRYLFNESTAFVRQRGLDEWIEELDPDILVVEANPRLLTTRRVNKWMHRHGRPVIGWGLGYFPRAGMRGWLQQLAYRALAKTFDGAIAYGNEAAVTYMNLGMPRDRVFVAQNAVCEAPSEFLPVAPYENSMRLIYVGRIVERKKLDELIDACHELRNDVDVFLDVVGDGPHRLECESLATRLGVRCHFHGHLSGEHLTRVFSRSHVFVMPGPGGLAIQDALSRSRPIVVAQGDGTQSDTVGSDNGWFVKESGLADVLRQAHRDRFRWDEMARRSYARACESNHVGGMVDAFEHAILEVASAGVRGSGAKG